MMCKSLLTRITLCLFVFGLLLAPSPARTDANKGSQVTATDSVVAWYSGTYVQVSWDHDPAAEISGYNVYRSIDSSGTWERLNPEPFQPYVFVDSSAPRDSLVLYRVTAVGLDDSEIDVGPAVQVSTAGSPESLPSVLTAQAYDKNNIITDSQLTNTTAMSQTQIQSFLDSQGSILANYSTGGKTAAQHIFDNCQIHGISPYVVLVTLQKEKGLIKSNTANPNSFAMGWNTSDSSTADFANQIYYGTRQFRRYYDDLGSYGSTVGQPYALSDGTDTAANLATAGLYIYTPWIGQGGGGQVGVGGNYLFWDLWYQTFRFDPSLSPTITQPPGVVLNPNGTSTIGWMFETTDWTNTRGPGTGTHVGDDWYADDWARGCGQTAGQNLYAGITGFLELNPNGDGGEDYYGNSVVIYDNTSSFALRYAHMKEFAPGLVNGQLICSGQFVGKVGNTGNVTSTTCTIDPGAHLHVVLYKNVSGLVGRPIHNTSFSGGPTTYSAPFLYQPQRQRIVDSNCSVVQCGVGSSVTYRAMGNRPPIHPNGTLIKVSGDTTVYLIRGGQKMWVTSPSVLANLYQQANSNFSTDVITVASDELNRYPTGANVSSALPSNGRGQPEGRLIRQSGGTQVSIVTDGGHRRPFATQQAFLGLGYQFCKVIDVSDYSSYPQGAPVEAMPIITASISLNGQFSVGQTINGTFSLTNIGTASVTFAVVTIGGRLNGSTVTDFPFHTNVTLNAGQTIPYQDNFTFSSAGSYSFFPAYQTQDGVWKIGLNHEIPTDPGVNDLVTLNVTPCNAPGAFSLISPTNGQSLSQTSSVTLSWGTSANANSYDVYFGTSSNPPLLANQTGTSRSVNVTAGQTYFWKVVARVGCNASLTFTAGIWSFSVQSCNAPASFSLISPTNGQSLSQTSSVTLSWGTSANANSYDVYFGTSSNPPFLANQAGTSRSVNVTAGQTYFWKVVARVSCDASLTFTAGIWSFSVQSCNAPGAFSLTSPSNGQSLSQTSSVTLSWGTSANANSYDVYFGTSSNPPFLANQSSTSRSVNVTAGQTYFWKVVARVSCDASLPFTAGIWSFSVQSCNAPGAFSLTSPSNGQMLSQTSSVTLSWGTSGNANSYDVYFGTSSNPPFLANQAGTSRSVNVTAGQTYFWKVVARVSCNASLTFTAGIWSFSVQTEPANYQGYLDAAGCGIITGWAWNANLPNTVINVDIFDGGNFIISIPANLFREDIVNAGIGNGFHGFSFTVPSSLKNGQPHNIRALFAGTGTELTNSPRTINCSGAPPLYQGYHDAAGCNTIAGWAWDANDPDNPINVDIYDGTTLIATVPSIQFRPDLVTAGIGNGFHGFSFTLPASLKDGQPHSIRVKFPGTNTDLNNTPRTISCSGAPPAYQGFHDGADCNVISGWAWDANDPDQPINVAIYADGQLMATVLAIQFRQDLVNAGIGNGYHGFVFNTPASLKDGQAHSIRVRFSGTNTDLSSTPRIITCTTGSQLFGNPGFESGGVVWSATPFVITNAAAQPAHGGTWKAWLNGYATAHTDTLSQTVTIPSASVSATLTFWLHIETAETPSFPFDTLKVQVRNAAGTVVLATLVTYSNLDSAAGYSLKSFDVTSFRGQTITIYFEGIEDVSFQTSFVIDDTALNVQ
jgi:fibronectin type 3 domain-containing protein